MGKHRAKGKMVIVTVRFFTTNLEEKAVWDSGAVYLPKQTRHGIEPKEPEMFNGLEEIAVKIRKALRKHGIDVVRYNPDKTEGKILEK
jgi:hypothetical protein